MCQKSKSQSTKQKANVGFEKSAGAIRRKHRQKAGLLRPSISR
jgi:hypothetical protein